MISMIVAMLAGTALRTITPAHMPDREIEQGLSQLDAPLYQQHGGLGSIVAPIEVLPSGQMARQHEPDLHGQGQDAPGPEDAPQTQGSDAHGQGQEAPGPEDAPQTQGSDAHGQGQDAPGPEDAPQTQGSDAHGQGQEAPGLEDAPQTQGSDAHGQGQDAPGPEDAPQTQGFDAHGQGQDTPGPGDAPQTQGSDAHGQRQDPPGQGQDASNPGVGADHQAHHVNGHVGDAQGPGQDAHRAAQNELRQDQVRPGPSANSQSKQPTDKGTDVVSHSGVLEGECAVSSRENAQHHLQAAAPLPWQLPKDSELANKSASERQA